MNKIAIYVISFLVACAALFYLHTSQVDKAVQAARVEISQEMNRRLIELQDKADVATAELNTKIKEQDDAKNAEIESINRRYSSVIASLQSRANRPTSNNSNAGISNNSESPQGATGVQLFRSDAEFLTRYARDTSELQTELKSCYYKYEEVQYAFEQFKVSNGFVTSDIETTTD